MIYCNKCGAELKDDAKFCDSCGAAVTSEKSADSFSNNSMPVLEGGTEREKYQLFVDKFVITKKNKSETIAMSDIASAELSWGSANIVKKDKKTVMLGELKNEEIADWVNSINLYAQGEGNYTPLNSEETSAKAKKFNQKMVAVILAVIAVVCIVVFSGGNATISDDSVMTSDEAAIEDIDISIDGSIVDISGTVSFKKDIYDGYKVYISAVDEYGNVIKYHDITIYGSFKSGSKNDFSETFTYDENTDHFKVDGIAAD